MSAAELDAEDLAMLAEGFGAIARDLPDPAEARAALFDLGWADALGAHPAGVIGALFGALGRTGSAAGVLDDVVVAALGLDVDAGLAVVLPAPGSSAPPARRDGDRLEVEGTVTSRIDGADRAVVAVAGDPVAFVVVEDWAVPADLGIDPGRAIRRVRISLPAEEAVALDVSTGWETARAWARVALAHQLIGTSETMLDLARTHAVERMQFGRAIASFQAVRHRLAEALVAIEGARSVVAAWQPDADPLLAATAKSLAGRAARVVAANAQQVLAGIGFTTDHPFHLSMKRSMVLDAVAGSAATLPAEIGADLLARGAAPRLVEL